jgi:hypothetical protein
MKRPALQLYKGDWVRSEVGMCSIAAQGLWLRLLFIMDDSRECGFLTVNGRPLTDQEVARLTGVPVAEVTGLLLELEAADVFSRDDRGIVYCRRMVRDEDERRHAKRRIRDVRRKCSANSASRKSLRDSEMPEKARVSSRMYEDEDEDEDEDSSPSIKQENLKFSSTHAREQTPPPEGEVEALIRCHPKAAHFPPGRIPANIEHYAVEAIAVEARQHFDGSEARAIEHIRGRTLRIAALLEAEGRTQFISAPDKFFREFEYGKPDHLWRNSAAGVATHDTEGQPRPRNRAEERMQYNFDSAAEAVRILEMDFHATSGTCDAVESSAAVGGSG